MSFCNLSDCFLFFAYCRMCFYFFLSFYCWLLIKHIICLGDFLAICFVYYDHFCINVICISFPRAMQPPRYIPSELTPHFLPPASQGDARAGVGVGGDSADSTLSGSDGRSGRARRAGGEERDKSHKRKSNLNRSTTEEATADPFPLSHPSDSNGEYESRFWGAWGWGWGCGGGVWVWVGVYVWGWCGV